MATACGMKGHRAIASFASHLTPTQRRVLRCPKDKHTGEYVAQQVQREAMRMGLAKAQKVYVIQDGAVYLWNIFQDRFAHVAQGVLDFYHASDHLWALAHELFGETSDEAKRWAHKILHQLRHGKEGHVIQTLESLMAAPPPEQVHAADTIISTTEYFLAIATNRLRPTMKPTWSA